MKLSSRIHGVIDYLVVMFLLVSPSLFGLSGITSVFTYILGGVHLILTLTTNYELGVIKVVSLKIHGMIELIVSIALFIIAFYLGTIDGLISRNFYILFAIAVFITWLVSDYKSTPSH
jgi:hypothetical protein